MAGGRIAALLAGIALLLAGQGALAASYEFRQAAGQGVVDFVINPYAHFGYDGILGSLRGLDPGLVNRLGFQYGGVTARKLEATGAMARRVRSVLPRARIGGGFPENLRADYSERLPCDGENDVRAFTRAGLTGAAAGRYFWIDPSLVGAQDYYICIGKAQIRRGFDHLHFEEADNVLKESANRGEAVRGYARVREALLRYGAGLGVAVSFSGEPGLAREMPLDAVYVPARFYTEGFDREYRHRVETREGRGYTYVLSPAIAAHFAGLVGGRAVVLFYVDNFDFHQDDLRRMMELDGPNRRAMIVGSGRVAAEHGVVFVPSLDHCDGCVPPALVGDACEVSGGVSYYDAVVCGDLEAVGEAIRVQRRGR